MISAIADVEIKGMERLFNELHALTGKPMSKLLQERAGLLGRVMAERTVPFQPLGDYKGQRESGRAKVRADLGRVYSPPTKTYREVKDQGGQKTARAFYAALKAGQLDVARAILKRVGVRAGQLSIIEDRKSTRLNSSHT